MATIEFRGKPEKIYNADDSLAYERIKVPTIKRHHCDMAAFRKHPKIGPYANSDLFASILRRELRARNIAGYIRLDRVPADVSVDVSGFLARVTIDIE